MKLISKYYPWFIKTTTSVLYIIHTISSSLLKPLTDIVYNSMTKVYNLRKLYQPSIKNTAEFPSTLVSLWYIKQLFILIIRFSINIFANNIAYPTNERFKNILIVLEFFNFFELRIEKLYNILWHSPIIRSIYF